MNIKVALSNRHVHLTKEDAYKLFGENYELTIRRKLAQKGQFASEETVTLRKNNKEIERVRIVGPYRPYTQVELLEADNEYFGIKAPVRSSGDLEGSESMVIIGPYGEINALNSTIVSNRHIHMSEEDLKKFNRKNKEIVSVKLKNDKILDNVEIKSDDTCVLEMHINKDDAEKNNIESDMEVIIC